MDSFYGRRRCVISAIAQHPFPPGREAKATTGRREPRSAALLVSLGLHVIAALLLIGAVTHQQGAALPRKAVTVIALQSLLPAIPAAGAEAPQPAPPKPKFHPRQALAKAAPSPATRQTPPAPQTAPAPPPQAVAAAPPAAATVPAADPAPAVVAQASAAASAQPDTAPPIAYLVEVSRVIRINLNYPAQARQHGIAVVHIRIARDGTVLSAGVVQSSGAAELDREAREVVLRIHRFPEPPSAYVSAIGDFSIDQPIRFLG